MFQISLTHPPSQEETPFSDIDMDHISPSDFAGSQYISSDVNNLRMLFFLQIRPRGECLRPAKNATGDKANLNAIPKTIEHIAINIQNSIFYAVVLHRPFV